MKVYINDELKEVSAGLDLYRIIDSAGIEGVQERKGIAVAVDNEVVPRDRWESYRPVENAKIIIITATQGG